MDAAFVVEWLNLVLRWAHMIVGIAWIGASFYFIWLDNHLHPPLDPADAAKGIGGEVWAVHGGGFYTAKKFALAPEKLPPELHWFKWEAYTTLITGFFLLCLVYYYGAEMALIDPSVMPLTKPEAIAIGLGFLVLGWLVYDWLCRSAFGEDDAILGGLLMLYCAVSAWALCHLFSGRGAYIHFGAMLGTIMVLNVYFVIIPGQRELVKAKEEGRTPDPKYGLMGRQRSVHNTYFTLPVLFTMISSHYAGLYGHEWNWVLLILISVSGALVRVWFVQRHKGNQNPLVLASGLVVLAITALVSLPRPAGRYRSARILCRGPADLQGTLPILPRRQAHAGRLRRPAQGRPPRNPGGNPGPGRDDQPTGVGHPGHAARKPDPHDRCRATPDCALVQGRRRIAAMMVRPGRSAVAPPADGGIGGNRDLSLLDARHRAWTARPRAQLGRIRHQHAGSGSRLGRQCRLCRPAPARRAFREAWRGIRPHHQAGLSAPGPAPARYQGRRSGARSRSTRRRRHAL